MKYYKYKILEYGYINVKDNKIEYCKNLHQTNSKLIYKVLILYFKLRKIKYEVVE